MRTLSLALGVVALFTAQACTASDDSASGNGGSTGSGGNGNVSGSGADASSDAGAGNDAAGGSSGSGGRSPVFRICGLTSPAGDTCPLMDAYIDCLEAQCSNELSQCFGAENRRGNFAGGSCADFASCATTAGDPCQNDCAPDATCQTCLGGLVSCIQNGECRAPLCPDEPDGGAPPGDGGTTIGGTCADLEACCATLGEGAARDACLQTLFAARARGGDADCAIVFSSYKSAGVCS
jgi:hypothetical protein